MITPRDINQFAEKAGVTILALEQTRRHWRVEILNNNGKALVFASVTPHDARRAGLEIIRDMKKAKGRV